MEAPDAADADAAELSVDVVAVVLIFTLVGD